MYTMYLVCFFLLPFKVVGMVKLHILNNRSKHTHVAGLSLVKRKMILVLMRQEKRVDLTAALQMLPENTVLHFYIKTTLLSPLKSFIKVLP